MALLPPTRTIPLAITVGVLSLVWLAAGGGAFYNGWFVRQEYFALGMGFFCWAVAYGLWRLRAWARATTVVVTWLGIITPPILWIGGKGTDLRSVPSPEVAFPLMAIGIVALHFLGKYHTEFRKP